MDVLSRGSKKTCKENSRRRRRRSRRRRSKTGSSPPPPPPALGFLSDAVGGGGPVADIYNIGMR